MALGTPTDGGVAYSAANGTSVAPAYPAGISAGDCLVLIVGMRPSAANGGTATTPSGWTLRETLTGAGGYGTSLTTDVGNTNLWIYTKDTVLGSETGSLSVTIGTNNVSWGLIVRVPTSGGALTYGSADGSRTSAPTSGTAFTTLLTNGTTAPNLQNGDIALWAMCIPTDVLANGFTVPTISSTGTTFATAVELEEPDSNLGNDIGGYVAYAAATAGSSTAAPTVGVTATGTVTNVRGPIALLRIREAVVTRTGSLAATETGIDAFSASGNVVVQGALTVSETGVDTFAATGSVTDSAISGSMAATETGLDTFSASGNVVISGALSATEVGDDSFTSFGTVLVQGALNATEVEFDTFAATGQVVVSGSLSTSETGEDTFSSSGTVLVQGSLSATENGLDTFAATGTVGSAAISGALAAVEVGNDVFVATGFVEIFGSMSANEAGDDVFSADGTVISQPTAGITGGGIRRSKILEAAQWILDLLDRDTVKQTEPIKKVKAKLRKVKKPEDLQDLQPIITVAIAEVQNQKKLSEDISRLNLVIKELKMIRDQLDDEEEALLMLMA